MVQVIQSRTRHGWNINGQNAGNWQFLISEAKKNPPRWTLVMDNQDRVRIWKDEIGGEVTYRAWSTNEDYYHQSNDAKATAQQMARHTEKVADCWQYWHMNEPGSGGTVQGWLELQDWLIAYATEAKRLGRKVTANGLAILKNWDFPTFVQAGHVDKLIKFWAAGNNREWFIPNVHTYMTGTPWATVMPNYPANLLDLNAMRSGLTTAHLQYTSYEPTMWYFREFWAFNIRALDIIGEPVEYIIDECFFDYHASVHQAFVTLADGRRAKMEDELRARYGDPAFDREMKGILGQRKFIEWIITGQLNTPVSDEQYCDYLVMIYQWLEDEIPDNALAFMNYTMNPAWRYPNSGGGGFGHDANPLIFALLPRMAKIRPRTQTQEPPMVLNPDPQTVVTVPHMVKGTNSIKNIRALPSTSSDIVGQVPYPDASQFELSVAALWAANGYNWHLIKWQDADTMKQGFVASSIINAVPVMVEPPPTDYSEQEKALIAAYRANDLQAMFDLIKPDLLFHDLTLGQATIAVPKPFMTLLGEVIHALATYIENDEGVR